MKKIIGTLLLSSCLLTAFAQPAPKPPPEEPLWIKSARLPDYGVTVYYDLLSLQRDKDFVRGILLYVEDNPKEMRMSPTVTKKIASRVIVVIVNCRTYQYLVSESHWFEQTMPKAKDSPINSKLFDPPEIKPMDANSALDQTFCSRPGLTA